MKTTTMLILSTFALMFFVACGPADDSNGSPFGFGVGSTSGPQCSQNEVDSLQQCMQQCYDATCVNNCFNSLQGSCDRCTQTWISCVQREGCDASQPGCCDREYNACFPMKKATQPSNTNSYSQESCSVGEMGSLNQCLGQCGQDTNCRSGCFDQLRTGCRVCIVRWGQCSKNLGCDLYDQGCCDAERARCNG
jgi:hypothetical protein